MASIGDAYLNALLADATYALEEDGLQNKTGKDLADILSLRMTPVLAKYIGDNFTVMTHIETGDFLGSGFDATVWKENATGKIFISMQGTAGASDFATDGTLALFSGAKPQIVDMVNWWLRITTPVGESARQIENPAPGIWQLGSSVLGTGELAGVSNAQINGHSLGGHLATAFARIFGGSVTIDDINTFNSPGFNTVQAESLFTSIQTLLGTGLNTYSSAQSNYYAANGTDFTTNEWWFAQKGTRVGVFQEDGLGSIFGVIPDPFSNHYMYKLTDALALGSALEKLDNTFTVTKLNAIIKAGSNEMAGSYEGVLDALLKILVAPSVAPLPVGDVSSSAASRVHYHEAIAGLLKTPAFTSLEGKLLIKGSDANALKAAARNSFSALVALTDLSPISITGKDAAADVVLNFFLQQSRAADYAAWEADKSTAHPTTFTDQWLADRSAMLGYVILANKSDITGPVSVAGAQGMHYEDIASGKVIDIGLVNDVLEKRQVLFGSDGNDVDGKLTGKSKDDRIYGGAGNDILDGQGGSDYLEGGSGDDAYSFSGAYGKDAIVDSDGLGQIKINGLGLGEIKGDGSGGWTSTLTDNTVVTLKLLDDARSSTGKKLVIQISGDSSNTITINNFDESKARSEAGYLGIKLGDRKLAITEAGAELGSGQTNANYWSGLSASLSDLNGKSSSLTEGAARSFLISLNQAAKAGDTVTLNLSGFQAQAILGDRKVEANGAVIALVAGQTTVSFALIAPDDISSDLTGNVSVTYRSGNESATSNSWSLNVKNTGDAIKTFIGDQRAQLWGAELQPEPVVEEDGTVTQDIIGPDDPRYNTYAWSKTEWAADGTLTGGVVQADFNDVITGTDENDKIQGMGGNDALDGGDGIDQIEGGDGDDLIGGGKGSDHIQGGAGNDYILSAHSLAVPQRQGVNDDWNPPGGELVLLEGSTWGVYVRASGGDMVDGGGPVARDSAGDIIDAGGGDDVVIASHGDDRIDGGAGTDQLEGGGGNDVIEGGTDRDFVWGDGPNAAGTYSYTPQDQHGDDFLDGGEGDDQVIGQGGSDVVYGGAGNDYLHGDHTMSHPDYSGPWLLDGAYHGQDYLDGEDGNDAMYGGGRDDVLYGGAGNDMMEGDDTQNQLAGIYHGDDYLDGEAGDDSMAGGGGHDTLYGGSGKDLIYGDSVTDPAHGVAAEFHGSDYLDGEDDDDEIVGGGRDDILYGGSGNDVLIGDDTSSILAGEHHGDDYMDGEDGDDQLLGGGGRDTLYGGDGNDLMYGDDDPELLAAEYHADDYLDGGKGDDQMSGGGGDDILLGGAGDDILVGGDGADYLDGGEGNDTIRAGAGDAVSDLLGSNFLTLVDGEPLTVTASGVDLILDYGDDGILVVAGALQGGTESIDDVWMPDWLKGRLTDDVELSTSREDQRLLGGDGNDVITSNHSHTYLNGGGGDDTLIGGDGFIGMSGGTGNDLLQAGGGDSELDGGAGNDQILAGAGKDELSGGDGDDVLQGEGGDDWLSGGAGNDVLLGGDGDDYLRAGSGVDRLEGGAGRDTYALRSGMGQVTASDFSEEGSVIQLGWSGEIDFDNLVAEKRQNDLVINVLGTETSFRIKDYYSMQTASWVIQNANEETITAQALIDASWPQWTDLSASLLNQFKNWAKSSITLGAASQGYELQEDGSWHAYAPEFNGGSTLSNGIRTTTFHRQTEHWGMVYDPNHSEIDPATGMITHYRIDVDGGVRSVDYSSSTTSSWASGNLSPQPLFLDGELDLYLTETTQLITESSVNLNSANSISYIKDAWQINQWDPYRTSTLQPGIWQFQNIVLRPDSTLPTEALINYTATSITDTQYRGIGIDLTYSNPGAAALTGPLPTHTKHHQVDRVDTYNVGETYLSAGDRTVIADEYSIVIGSAGNITVEDAGYAYGGAGSARLLGGKMLVAGSGEQYLQNGETMVVGDGQTTVAGRVLVDLESHSELPRWWKHEVRPDTRILVNPNNTGIDILISDSGQITDEEGDGEEDDIESFYLSQRILDIRESYAYAGQYTLGKYGLNSQNPYFNTKEEAYEYFVEDGGNDYEYFLESLRYVEPLKILLQDDWENIVLDSELTAASYYEELPFSVERVAATSFSAIEEFGRAGLMPQRTVVFGPGLGLVDINLSWGQMTSTWDGVMRVTLDLSWGTDQGLRVMIPRTLDPLNSTVQNFEFSDGSTVALSAMIALAPPAPNFDPDYLRLETGLGSLVVNSEDVRGISVPYDDLGEIDIRSSGEEGLDLVLSINDGQDSITLKDWYVGYRYQSDFPIILNDAKIYSSEDLSDIGTSHLENGGRDYYFDESPGNEIIDGGLGDDILHGGGGNDILLGGGGDDNLSDDAGSNILLGGAGDDYLSASLGPAFMAGGRGWDYSAGAGAAAVVAYNAGDDADVVFSRNGLTLSLGGGLGIADLQVYRTPSGFVLWMSDTDGIRLADYPANGQISIKLQFIGEDVRVYDLAAALEDFLAAGGGTTARPLADYLSAHLLTVSSSEAIGGRLAYEYATARNLHALTAEEMQTILAEPGFGSEAQDILTEHAPTLNQPVADLATLQPLAFSHQFAAETFTDVDAGDVLVWSLTQADGQPLPDWLAFDTTTRTLSGTPRNRNAGELELLLTVTDTTGLSANQEFTLTVHETEGVFVTGTADADVLTGGAGDDLIDGGAGADRMVGGDGEDLYVVDNTRDVVIEEADHGADRVESFISYTAPANVEVVALMGEANISAKGNELDNRLQGNTGSNRLDGGSGADQLVGGLGNDTYLVDDAGDVVMELADEGTDTVQSLVDYTLGANLENLTLTGTAATSGTGNELNNVITGNAAGNTLRGLGGNDTLRGGLESDLLEGGEGNDRLDGGIGADHLLGGLGNDVYVVDEAGDVVMELADEGTDTVQSLVDYTLGANVENLTLTGTAATSGTGNELNNVITGNAAGNTLRGLGGNDTLRGGLEADVLEGGEGNDRLDGGVGADQLLGGVGNDTYVVDEIGDVVLELADEGTDTVQSLVDYALGVNLENLTLTGTAATSGTGNELNNVITGNAAGNTLRGLGGNDTLRGGLEVDILEGGEGNDRLDGGAGADQLAGGLGNDTYVVDELGDVVLELADEGADSVQSLVDYTLGVNLENLTLTGVAATSGTGNELNNVITGNAAGNTLRGLGGNDTLRGGLETDVLEGGEGNDRLDGSAGADQLAGGLGNDTYVVDELGDVVVEMSDEGTDTVQSLVDYALGVNLENLTLTGTAATSGTGNELNNVITGNAAGNTLRGLGGNDTLRGGLEADVLEGGEGNDRLEGGLGADTYLFSRGEGQDTVVDTDATMDVNDVLQFGADISAEQIWLRKSGNHLEISLLGTTDKVTVANWYLGEDRRVEVLQLANGQQLLDTQVQNLVQAMAAFAPPAAGQTTLPENYATTLAPVIAANWQ